MQECREQRLRSLKRMRKIDFADYSGIVDCNRDGPPEVGAEMIEMVREGLLQV